MSEMVSFSINFAIIGILIVFGALALISVIITLVRKADDHWQSREETQRDEATQKTPTIDNLTLVLITAAVATIITGRFHIRKVRRLKRQDTTARTWSVQGRAILHGSHVVPKKGGR